MKNLLLKIVELFLIFVFISATNAAALNSKPKWYSKLRQIKLMITTRQEVEKLFDHPKVTYTYDGAVGRSVEYKIKEGRLSVVYSLGKCSKASDYGYDVERDMVINV